MLIRGLELLIAPLQPGPIGAVRELVLGVHQDLELFFLVDAMKEWDDAVLRGNEMDGALFEFAEPGGEYLRRVHGGRKKNELYGGIQEDHRLLPDGAPVLVIDIVTLIEDDGVKANQR